MDNSSFLYLPADKGSQRSEPRGFGAIKIIVLDIGTMLGTVSCPFTSRQIKIELPELTLCAHRQQKHLYLRAFEEFLPIQFAIKGTMQVPLTT